MPALVACGRVWEIGSDDLFFPGIVSVAVRIIWFLGLLGGVIYFRDALGCESMHYLAIFVSILLFTALTGVIIEGSIVFFSARGSIVRVKPRRPVVPLLYARITLFAIDTLLLIVGTAFSYQSEKESDRLDCPNLDIAITMMQVIVGVLWFIFITMVVVVVTYLDPCHCYSAKVNYRQVTRQIQDGNIDQEVVETQWKLTHTVWEKRFKVACCIAGSDDVHQLAYREVAEIFAHLFCDTNVVMSDIAAGLILLQKEHLAQEEEERQNLHLRKNQGDSIDGDDEPALSFDFHNQEDRELFKDGLHFLKYALGMYSWPIYVYMNPLVGLCRLWSHLDCCGRSRNVYDNVHKDNRCRCYLGGLRQMTGLNELDIIYLSFENDVYMVPYMVCLDHETKSVVVAFRGTLSFGDIITDLSASTKPIQLSSNPDFLVHKGMLKTVTAIMEKIDEDGILESAFRRVPQYKLVFVGHSLGAGCACLMAMLLREKYPDLRCFCYSPTGALVNEAAAKYTEEFVTSFTLGRDLVARLNVPNTHKLKEDLVRVIESCHKPKCRIIFEGCLETLCTCFGRSVVFHNPSPDIANGEPRDITEASNLLENDQLTAEESNDEHHAESLVAISIDPEESLPPTTTSSHNSPHSPALRRSEITPILHPSLSSLKLPVRSEKRNSSPVTSLTQEVARRLVPLFAPGRIIHIVDQSKNKPCFCGSRQLEVTWASKHKFNKIQVSPDMVRDHFPDVIFRAMNKIWNKKIEDLEDSEIRLHHQM